MLKICPYQTIVLGKTSRRIDLAKPKGMSRERLRLPVGKSPSGNRVRIERAGLVAQRLFDGVYPLL